MAVATTPARRSLTIKPLHVVGLGIILLAVVYGFFGFQDGFRAYTTSVDEAMRSTRSVQLAGFLGSTGEIDAQGRFTFMLQDENGKLIKVISDDPRPANFEQAISIVAIGRYDPAEQAFMADDLLVKCPSKYQEMNQAKP
ncbi:cytochrome c maturation protein CcmE [Chloroflexus sp.]|uniref:cytochrome c maturation protein CcmE domain-containing protein n=1 Tax=Chloroflexus sp. TaxID=1904827 RepID=UPI00298EF6DD|nr:cytochrome c maturation protein CcmE [Chloroflexus sp.]MCX7859380.1 cytochrome c maturation protein CcmE [Chloroflexus sp.]MDW8404900.1 cytochrome c maturation protein CcmE [Chloroflexus sp.]